MLQKGPRLAAELKSFGAAVLSALEKKDSETLALLRAEHETNMLKAIREVRQQQISEANATLEGVRKTRDATNERYEFYKAVEFMNAAEGLHLTLAGVAGMLQVIAQASEIGAAVEYALPNETFGIAGSFGSPVSLVTLSGQQGGDATSSFGKAMNVFASYTNTLATMSGTLGSFERRWDDWKLQERLAVKELEHIDKQIAAAEIHVAITEQELANHDKQIDTPQPSKISSEQIHDAATLRLMLSKLSAAFFQL
jgi:hypothetical protein